MIEARIRRCAVHGLRDRAGTQRVVDAIDTVRWPQRRQRLYLRHVQVRAAVAGLGDALQAELDRLREEAVTYRCGDVIASESPALVFADEAEECAALSHDLASARAGACWWWRGRVELLALPPSSALARLWCEQVLRVPDIIARLQRSGLLAPVLSLLDADGLRRITAELLRAVQGSATLLRPVAVTAVPPLVSAPRPSQSEVRQLRALIHSHPAAAELAHAITLFWLLRQEPWTLRSASATERVGICRQCLTDIVLPAETTMTLPYGDVPATTPPYSQAASSARKQAATAAAAQQVDATAPVLGLSEDRLFASPYAAVIYLVNVLQHPQIWPVLADSAILERDGHAWHVLLAVATTLGLPVADPVSEYLQEQVPEHTQPLPPALLTALVARSRAVFDDLQLESVLRISGTWLCTSTHIDVYLPLAAVRLDVRLQGLDLSPGWLPWLGRVVTIHYIEEPT